jgi:hypothetical protein
MVRLSMLIPRYRWARGVGLDRATAILFAFDIGHSDVLAEAADYVKGGRD